MTTVNRILLKLDYLAKEQEERLTLPALNDVIGQFEAAFAVPYSEAGIPLLTEYFDKVSRTPTRPSSPPKSAGQGRKVARPILTPKGTELADADDAELNPEEQKRAHFARGVRENYNNVKKEHEKYENIDMDLLKPYYNEMMQGLVGSNPAVEGGGRRQRTQGKPPKAAKQLMSAFAQQADDVAQAIADGKSEKEILGVAFPRNGLRMNMGSDAGVDIQVRVKMNTDGKSFKVEQRTGGKGKFKTVKGGENVNNFGSAVRHGEDAIIAKAKGRQAQFGGVDIGKNRRQNRAWLNANVRQDFGGPMTNLAPESKDKEKYADEYEKNISQQLEDAGINEEFMSEAAKFGGDDIIDGDAAEALPSIIDNAPNLALSSILASVASGRITSPNQLRRTLKETSKKISENSQHGAGSSNNEKPGTSGWGGKSEAKKGIGGIFSEWGKAFSSGWSEGWEKGQHFGAHTLGGAKYRAPDSEQYEKDPRGYWAERGKLATMLARADNQYTDDIDAAMGMGEVEMEEVTVNGKKTFKVKQREVSFVDADGNAQKYMQNVNPREDAIEKAMVRLAKSEDKIEAMASDNTGSSLEAIREHVDQIRDGNKDAMPPSEGWPNRDGGWQLRNKLEKNNELIPDKPAGSRGSRAAEWMMGQRGRQKKASGEAGGIAEGEVGDARQTQQERPNLVDEVVPQLDEEGNPVLDEQGQPVPQLDEEGNPVTRKIVDPEGGQHTAAVSAREDREYLDPGDTPPEGVKEYQAERRGKDGKRARYYSRKEAAAVRNQQQNGGSGDDDTTEPEPTPTPTEPTTPTPTPTPTPKLQASPEDEERLRGRREGGRRKATQVREEPDEQEIGKAGENEMAPTNAPKTPQDAQADQYQKAMENEVAGAKRVSQHSKARSAKANARVAKARADEAEVKARRAEDDREVHISELLHKLDSNISELTIAADPDISDVFKHLSGTIENLEKGIFKPKPDVRIGPRPDPSIIEPPPSEKPQEGLDYTRGSSLPKKKKGISAADTDDSEERPVELPQEIKDKIKKIVRRQKNKTAALAPGTEGWAQPMGTSANGKAGGSTGRRTIQNASEIDKQGNPFASLAGHMGAAFREAGKATKKPTTPRRQPKPTLPEYDPQPTPDKPALKTNSTNGAGSAGGA